MKCPHCMDDSSPDSNDFMSLSTFQNAVYFGRDLNIYIYVLSGGEPTENADLFKMCAWFDTNFKGTAHTFVLCSNGMWLKDPEKCEMIRKITELYTCCAIQIYTNKKWYKEYDYVVSHKEQYEAFQKTFVEIDTPIWMQDRGRAHYSKDSFEEAKRNKYFMSCLNCLLLARQTSMEEYGWKSFTSRLQCKPSIDSDGNVRASESRMCPSVGNVNIDSSSTIYLRLSKMKPCGSCLGYMRFMKNQDQKILQAKRILDL